MSTRTQPAGAEVLATSNDEGFEAVGRWCSRHRADAFRALGLTLVQGRREGVHLWDLDGKRYVNCRSSGGVFDLGHRPAVAIEAMQRGLVEIGDIGDWLVPSAWRAKAAAALASTLPGDLHYTFFTPGGGEAVEVACKLARAVTGRSGIVAAEHGYHGHVGFALAMDEPRDSHWFGPLVPGIVKVPFGDLGAVDRAVGDTTAAVCMETVPATAGYLVPTDEFWPGVRRICDDRGALLILDEVQSGLGRTGRVWACEHWDVSPDLLVAGKGLSGGVYPVAACCFGDAVDVFLGQDPFFHPSSFGGAELAMPVVEAVVQTVAAPGFCEHVVEMGARLADGFDALCARYPDLFVGHRGLGLMRALDTVSVEACGALMLSSIEHGVLAVWANNKQETLLVMPPLVIEADEVDEVLAGLASAASAVAPGR